MPLNDFPWTRPVKINLQCGLERSFIGVYDALDFLENEWPLRHGKRYKRAVKTCRDTLNGAIPAVIAREAFIAACLEAGMSAAMAPAKESSLSIRAAPSASQHPVGQRRPRLRPPQHREDHNDAAIAYATARLFAIVPR